MTDELGKILDKVSDPADVAVVLLAGTAGFVVDAGLNAVGFLEPGYVGITAASAALGVKQAITAAAAKRREKRTRQKEYEDRHRRAESLLRLLEKKEHNDLARRLQHEMELFRSEIIDPVSFDAGMQEIVDEYRSRIDPPPAAVA